MAYGMEAVDDVSLHICETWKLAPFLAVDSYGKHSQPSGNKIPRQGWRGCAFGGLAESGLALQWKEIGVGASVGVSVNIHLGVPAGTCLGFVIPEAQLHLSLSPE